MYHWCLPFAFLGLVVISQEHNSNCSAGIELDGIYCTPRCNSQSPDWKKFFFFFFFLLHWCENCLFALVHNKLVILSLTVNSSPECHIQIFLLPSLSMHIFGFTLGLYCTFYLPVTRCVLCRKRDFCSSRQNVTWTWSGGAHLVLGRLLRVITLT